MAGAAGAATYHVDCSEAKWRSLDAVESLDLRPGDQLLLRSGCRWQGTLSPKGSGSEGHPIVIDRYGEGPLPAIDGNGAESAVSLNNQEFWVVRNLEITNDAAQPGLRRGVLVRAQNLGRALRSIHLSGLDIHNVKGRLGADMVSKATGGIGFEIVAKEKPTRLDDILVENNRVHSVDNLGIYIDTDVSPHPRDPQWEQLRHTGVVVRGNTLEDIGKNAMCIRASLGPVIAHNVVRRAAARMHGNAIYVFGCKDARMEYNEVSGTSYLKGIEGAAFDSDYNSEGTVIQYNYAHDNGGGLVDICSNPASKAPRGYNDGTIVRYNISRNDTDRVVAFDGPATHTQIYNNTLYVGTGRKPHIVEFDLFGKDPGYADHTWIRNNAIVNDGDGTYLYGQATNYFFEGNCFAGHHPANEPADPRKVAPGAGGDCPAGVGAGPIEMQPYRVMEGLVWSSPDGFDLKGDLYLPKGTGPFPAVVYLHGGGWSSGDRKQLRRPAADLAAAGIAGFAVDYRLAPRFPYPAALQDAEAAVKWLRNNALQYHVDSRRIAVAGSSAGGHLAILLALASKQPVAAVVAFNPVLDLTDMAPRESLTTKFLGGTCADLPAVCRDASPMYHVHATSIPFLILHGTADDTVPYRQAATMVQKLTGAGVAAHLFTAQDGPHTFWADPRWYQDSLRAVQEFLSELR